MLTTDPSLRLEMSIERDRSELRISYRDRASLVRMLRPDRLEWGNHFGVSRRAHFTTDAMQTSIVDGRKHTDLELRLLLLDGLKLPRVREEVIGAAIDLWLEVTIRQWCLRRPEPATLPVLPITPAATQASYPDSP